MTGLALWATACLWLIGIAALFTLAAFLADHLAPEGPTDD